MYIQDNGSLFTVILSPKDTREYAHSVRGRVWFRFHKGDYVFRATNFYERPRANSVDYARLRRAAWEYICKHDSLPGERNR